MKTTALLACALLSAPGVSRASEVVLSLPWTRAPQGATLVPAAPGRAGAHIRVERAAGGTLPLLTIDRPPVSRSTWAVAGEVRYEDVEGRGYLEMWSAFPQGDRFFTRTLAPAGPMAEISGSSPWRPFLLPFASRPDAPAPSALEVGLVLPGKGKVEIGPLRLLQFEPGEDPFAVAGAWWSDRRAAWVGGLGGSLLGLVGALVGWLGGRGKAPRLVLSLTATLAAIGPILLAAGVYALAARQPYGVWYPLVLGGLLLLVGMGLGYRRLRERYRQLELRRMQALDAR